MLRRDRIFAHRLLWVAVAGAALLFVAMGVPAQDQRRSGTLTLPDAVDTALQQNPTHVTEGLEVNRAEREQVAAHGAYWPQLDFGASATRYGFPTFVTSIRQIGVFPPLDTTIYQYGVALRIPLYLGGRLEQGVIRADIGSVIARERERLGTQELVFNVASAYLKIVQLDSLVAAYDARIGSLEAQQRSVELMNKVGRAPRLDLLKISTLLTRARYERLQVENRRQEAFTLLYNFMGAEVPTTPPALLAYRVRAVNTTAAVTTLERDAAAHRPELRIAEQQVASARAQEHIARGQRLPSVSVVGRYGESSGADTAVFNDWNVGVQLTVPILDGGIRRAREEEAAIARAQAQEAVRRTRLDVSRQVRDAVNAGQEAESRVQVTMHSVAESKEALSIEHLRYAQGVGVITDLLNAESAVLTAQAERLQAQFDAVMAQLNLLKVTGRLDVERVAKILTRTEREHS